MDKHLILRESTFGHRVAEEEIEVLSTYFVETDHWSRLFRGDIDIVYGPKGSGKSALYSLLIARGGELFDQNILLVAGENPRGAPVFRDLMADPPASEPEFVGLWKLYFCSLIFNALDDYGIKNTSRNKLEESLVREGLVKRGFSIENMLRAAADYVRGALRPQGVEGSVELDPLTQLPKGFTGKIIFSQHGKSSGEGVRSVDELLSFANDSLTDAGFKVWLLLDRLDVAFAENVELETNALRALFRVYLDLNAYQHIKTKLFLRTDIWKRITDEGFREASHITRHVTISWNRSSLLNLVVRRTLYNNAIRIAYNVTNELPRKDVNAQEEFFYRICPNQVDIGPNKPNTFDWLLSRTRDGTKFNAPREVIHFLNCLREVEIRRQEIGEVEPDGEQLFARASFKLALPDVSRVRLEQTLYAEYPRFKEWLEKLRGAKASQTPESLAAVWKISPEESSQRAYDLASVGFFEARGSRERPEYWVPFLYRDALDLIQGAAD